MITEVFGTPGCGKSTLMASIVQINKRKRDKYYKRVGKSKLFNFLYVKNKIATNKLSSPRVQHKILHFKELKFIDKIKFRWLLMKCNISIMLFDLLYKKNFYDVIYCTDETMQDTVFVDYKDWGQFKPTWNSLFLGEEAGIGLDNRSYKDLSKFSKRFAAMHRHSGCDIFLVSQTVDIDKVYRQRAENLFHATKLGPFTILRRIVYQVDVDETTHTLMDMYKKLPFLNWAIELIGSLRRKNRYQKIRWKRSYIIYRPKWYKYFDSYVDNFDYPKPDPYLVWLDKQEQKEQIV